jgi:cytochrome P450
MSETLDAAMLTQFPAARGCPFDPPQPYLDLQREEPVSRVRLASGLEAWLITKHADVRALLDDERLSADESKPGYPFLYEGAFASPLHGTFMRADGADHYRVRRMLSRDFTVARATVLRADVQSVVDECLDEMDAAGRTADLVTALAFPVPSRTICDVLGVPYTDRQVFLDNTRAMINIRSTQEQVQAAMGAIFGYLDNLITAKQAAPGDDLLSRLITEELQPGHLDRQELVTIALILLVGGHETTATMIGLGVFALLEHPDALAELIAEPGLWPAAVDELLRHQTIVQNPIQRAVLEDIEIGGRLLRAGEGVLFALETANRDAEVFAEPDRLDWRRDNVRSHVAFSFGPHQCLGHAVARMELEVTFRSLFERFPTLKLAVDRDEVPLRPATVGLFGVEALPVTW